ncbi:MAG: methyltransferase FkbM family [Magnetococcales bacterium]|nr:methyltransferase FkbM family [Magnetococcales bacterium]
MDQQALRTTIQKALISLETGQRVDKKEVGACLSFVWGRDPSAEEVDAAVTQLRMIPSFLGMDEKIGLVLHALDETVAGTPFLQEQKLSVDELFDSVTARKPLSFKVRHDFGVVGDMHEQCLTKAIKEGKLTRSQALACINDGERLTKHLSGMNHFSVPLIFRTTDYNGMPQTGYRVDAVTFQQVVHCQTPGGSFALMVSNESELRQVAIPEHDTLNWLNNTINQDSVLFDVGANVGYYSLYAVSCQPGARAVAFEPAPMNIARINANIHMNHLDSSILAFPIALSDETRVQKFGNSYLVSGGWSHRGIDSRKTVPGEIFFSGCVGYTMDDFVRSAPFVSPPTHMKIDVDGPEMRVLRGAMTTLQHPNLRHLLIELRDDQEAVEAEFILKKFGFQPARPSFSGFGNRIFQRSS